MKIQEYLSESLVNAKTVGSFKNRKPNIDQYPTIGCGKQAVVDWLESNGVDGIEFSKMANRGLALPALALGDLSYIIGPYYNRRPETEWVILCNHYKQNVRINTNIGIESHFREDKSNPINLYLEFEEAIRVAKYMIEHPKEKITRDKIVKIIGNLSECLDEAVVNSKTIRNLRSNRKDIAEIIGNTNLSTVSDIVRFLDKKHCAIVTSFDAVRTEKLPFPKKNGRINVLANKTGDITEYVSLYTPSRQIIKIYPQQHIGHIIRKFFDDRGFPGEFHSNPEELTDVEWMRMVVELSDRPNTVF